MSRISENLRVVVIGENNEIRKGTIKSVCPEIRVAIVKMDDGNMEKVPYDRIGVDESRNENVSTEPEKVQEVQEEKTELQDGAKVITRESFNDVVHHVTSPEGMLNGKDIDVDPFSLTIKGMMVMIVGMKIGDELFQDKKEIEITEDQLMDVIKDKTDPHKVAEYVENKMSIAEVFPIALLSALLLMKAVTILFDDSKND